MTTFELDHAELFVPDRAVAAAWYARVLGCAPVPGTAHWADDPAGPLMISADGGRTKLALFAGPAHHAAATAGIHRVAFRTDAGSFLGFLDRLAELGLREADGAVRIVDHATAWSVYFTDPYGHRLEVTTYEHVPVREARRGLPT